MSDDIVFQSEQWKNFVRSSLELLDESIHDCRILEYELVAIANDDGTYKGMILSRFIDSTEVVFEGIDNDQTAFEAKFNTLCEACDLDIEDTMKSLYIGKRNSDPLAYRLFQIKMREDPELRLK